MTCLDGTSECTLTWRLSSWVFLNRWTLTKTQSNSAPTQPLASGAAATGFGATPSRLCKHFVGLHVYYSDRLYM